MRPNDQHRDPSGDADDGDWFVLAITTPGNVGKCLDAVMQRLVERRDFVLALRQRLWPDGQADCDAITQLGRRARELENTLRFRVSLLNPQREVSWFRRATHKDFGPFRSSLATEPVFAPYDPTLTTHLRSAIGNCWREKTRGPLPFLRQEPCLWSILLSLGSVAHQLANLPAPFAEFDFATLPDTLPSTLRAKSLVAFLTHVRLEFLAVRERLDLCFEHLWHASEPFWHHQLKSLRSDDSDPGRKLTRPEARTLTSRVREALRALGFDSLPTETVLKARFRELARITHPDAGGSAPSFIRLNRCYRELLEVIQEPASQGRPTASE